MARLSQQVRQSKLNFVVVVVVAVAVAVAVAVVVVVVVVVVIVVVVVVGGDGGDGGLNPEIVERSFPSSILTSRGPKISDVGEPSVKMVTLSTNGWTQTVNMKL